MKALKPELKLNSIAPPTPQKRKFSVGVCIDEEDTAILFGTLSTTKFEELKA